MSEHTNIEWTDATWNIITGCSVLSPACAHCYAMKLAGTRLRHHPSRKGLTVDSKAGPVWNGEVRFNEHWLTQPLQWRRPRRIFVCAHGDLFHESVPDEWIDRVFAVMALAPQHKYQVLTKRSARMRRYVGQRHSRNEVELAAERIKPSEGYAVSPKWCFQWPLPNVWLGVSAEDQACADERIPNLLQTPAAVRFLSLEPLLEAVDLRHLQPGDPPVEIDAINGTHGVLRPHGGVSPRLDWVIVGGESGPHARPMHPDWVRSLRDQCQAASVRFFFKQWGSWAPAPWKLQRLPDEAADAYKARSEAIAATHGVAVWGYPCKFDHAPWSIERADRGGPDHAGMRCVGKRAAGRELDGRTWSEMPDTGQQPQHLIEGNPVAGRPYRDAALSTP